MRERPVVWAIRYASRFRGLVCMISIDLRRAAWRCVVISLPCCIEPGCAGLRYMNCIFSLIYLMYFMEQAFSFRVFFEYKLPSGQAASQPAWHLLHRAERAAQGRQRADHRAAGGRPGRARTHPVTIIAC